MPTPSLHQLLDLTDKSAIVTGGAMGIGRGIAERLAEAGARVLIADINVGVAEEAAAAIRAAGGTAAVIQADASSVADAARVVHDATTRFGRLDILVNNAGIFPMAPALTVTEALWDKVLDINLKGAFFMAQAAARAMIDAGNGGRIINIASIDALHPTGALVHYDSSKGGMVMMTKALALELGRAGVTVNAIAPGGIQTPGAAAVTDALRAAGVPDLDSSAFTARIPLGRQGQPDDIAKVAVFLASGLADYITGEVIIVDGGYLLS